MIYVSIAQMHKNIGVQMC